MITRARSRMSTRALCIALLICAAWIHARSPVLSAAAAATDSGALLEPDIAVVDYVSPRTLLDAMPLFDATHPKGPAGTQRRPPSHTRPPPPLPHMQPPPAGAQHGRYAPPPPPTGARRAPPPPPSGAEQGRHAPPSPPPRRGEPRPVDPSPSGAQRYPPPPLPHQPRQQQPSTGKRPAVPPTGQQPRQRVSRPMPSASPTQQRNRPRRKVPAFDGGEVKPRQARHPRQQQEPQRQSPPPPPRGASQTHDPRAAPQSPAPTPRAAPSTADPKPAAAAPPVQELSRAQIRAEQARLYEQQKRKYAQLVAFHRGDPGATYPSGFEAGDGAAPQLEPEPSLEELREMLRRDGLLTPPAAADTAEAAAHLEGGLGAGAGGMFSVPPPRERQYDLPRLEPGRVPAWKQQQQGSQRRRRPVPAGAVESLARAGATLRRSRAPLARGAQAAEASFAEMKAQLLSDLSSESATLKLREGIDRLLRESLAKMTPEEMAAEIERLQATRTGAPAAAAAAATADAGKASTSATPAAASSAAAPTAAHR